LGALEVIGWIELALLATFSLLFAATAAAERAARAAWVGCSLALLCALVLVPLLLFSSPWIDSIRPFVIIGVGLIAIAVALPIQSPSPFRIGERVDRVDERDALFHRFYRLEPGSTDWDSYYGEHPELVEVDREIRAMPPLGCRRDGPETSLRFPALFAAMKLSDEVGALGGHLGPSVEAPTSLSGASPKERAQWVKGMARAAGASIVGCTRLDPRWIYSHVGRGPGTFGSPIELEHTHAVVIGVEMRHEMVSCAPESPATVETALRYIDASIAASAVTRLIAALGYEARAHVDGDYRVLCVPLAVDAGLGELGRHGLLINERFGTRLRLAAVTTTMALDVDAPRAFGVHAFCETCRKCSRCCPSGSIDRGDKGLHNGVEKWQSQQESCYRYWRRMGTDCGICMRVCPYSHPAGGAHELVRGLIRRNPLARRLAIVGDDLAYGKRPRKAPCSRIAWMPDASGRR